MRIYSRLEIIKKKKKRKLLYRTVVRVAVVPLVFVLAILLYFSMVSQKLEEVDQKEKTASNFAPDGASRDKEVAGEKTQIEKQVIVSPTATSVREKSPKPTQTSQQPASFPLPPTPTITQIVIPTPKPTVDPLLIDLPKELKETTSAFSIAKGELSFIVKADWGEENRQLFWGNFNGRDVKNLFQIIGSGNILVSDIYLEDGKIVNDECNVYFDEEASIMDGKEYKVGVKWDFQTEPWSEKIYINDVLRRECISSFKPVDNGGKIFIGPITNFSVL